MCWTQRTQRTQQRGLEKFGPHAREKLARVGACEVSVMFTEDVLGDHLHDVQFAHDVRCARHGAIEKKAVLDITYCENAKLSPQALSDARRSSLNRRQEQKSPNCWRHHSLKTFQGVCQCGCQALQNGLPKCPI